MPEDGGIKNENKTVGTHGEPSERNNPRYAVSIFIPQTVIDQYRANEKQDRASEKRRYRLEIAALIVAAFYAGVTWELWRNATATFEQNQKQFQSSERPWVGLIYLYHEGPVIFDSARGARVDVALTVENGGHSPAVNVFYFLQLVVAPNADDALQFMRANWCNRTKLTEVTNAFGQMLLPNLPDYDKTTITTVGPPVGNPPNGKYGIFLTSCIGYHDPSGDLLWVTQNPKTRTAIS